MMTWHWSSQRDTILLYCFCVSSFLCICLSRRVCVSCVELCDFVGMLCIDVNAIYISNYESDRTYLANLKLYCLNQSVTAVECFHCKSFCVRMEILFKSTVKPVYKDRSRDKKKCGLYRQVVFIDRWITVRIALLGLWKGGLYKQGVFIHRWSLGQVRLHIHFQSIQEYKFSIHVINLSATNDILHEYPTQ